MDQLDEAEQESQREEDMSGDLVMLWKKRGLNHIPGPGHKDTHTHTHTRLGIDFLWLSFF